MSSRRSVRQLLVAVLLGVLVGGGLMAVTPAGAEVSNAVATNWKKIWKKNLKPLADKRYYTKAGSDAKYQPKGSYDAAGAAAAAQAAATAAANSATDAKLGNFYNKADSDARFQRGTQLLRGSTTILFTATAASQYGAQDISFGTTFSAAPTVHLIPLAGPVPAGCSGSAAAPNADPGHVCVFTTFTSNFGTVTACKGSTAFCLGAADPWGFSVYASSAAAGSTQYFATWAARPSAVVSTASGRISPAPSGATSGFARRPLTDRGPAATLRGGGRSAVRGLSSSPRTGSRLER